MNSADVRRWALKGAEQRLIEIAEEARAIFVAFPELRAEGRGFDSAAATNASTQPAAATRRRRVMSAAARKRISDAQKARWAKQRAATQAADGPTKPGGNKGSRKNKK